MDKNAFTASQAFESYLWYHVLFLGMSLFGLILNNGTVRSNPFVIYKTTSMLCARLGVRCENVVKQTMCVIICNALVRVSGRMVRFSELLQLFNFPPDSDFVFFLRRFSLLTR